MRAARYSLIAGLCCAMALPLASCRREKGGGRGPVNPKPGETCFFVPVREKTVALTFDDGPNEPFTGQVLDALKFHGIKATFFLVGSNVERLPGTARRIRDEGHCIGGHSFAHLRFDQVAPAEAADDITRGNLAIEIATGVKPAWFRPPFGINAPGMEEVCRENGMVVVGWSLDANDWNPHPVQELVDRIVSQAVPGEIILLHDGWDIRPGGDRHRTAEAVPLIIERLKAQGFSFATLPELFGAAGKPLFDFGNGIRLLGLHISGVPVAPGGEFHARYFWDMPPAADNLPDKAFVDFLAPGGKAWFQDDYMIPARKDVRDAVLRHTVSVPLQAPCGLYDARIGIGSSHNAGISKRIWLRSLFSPGRKTALVRSALEVLRPVTHEN